ncbi:MAG TPA: molybdenum cofactor guanylyltransferase MobA [Acetobacteraceae bacterium]|jgi:molybdopterin-guanine dinucleotide biosynthesis protein A|nr:molybdenum cofactor guanylyltransferase MobA [Acetobacteraceae bacterium]
MTCDPSIPPTFGAILAGGLARRLGGGDKGLRMVGGRTVLARLADRLGPQVTRLILNANDDATRFAALGLPVVADSLADHPGPLAGVLAALDWTAEADPAVAWVVTVPGDAPFVPRDLVARLHAGRRDSGAVFACAASGDYTHPVIALWPVSIRDELRHAVAAQGMRKIDRFTQRHGCAAVVWPTDPVDPFFNVNTPEDLAEADRLVAIHPGL